VSTRKLTREEDKALWVETRLLASPGLTINQTFARRRKLELAYERLVRHELPQVCHWGTRLSSLANELFYRGVGRP
jgi:hypothetical protein